MNQEKNERPVAVITGASRGIGAETARQLARRGYALVLAARSEEPLRRLAEELARLGAPALAVPTDVRECPQLRQLAARVLEHFGHVDVLIHNAGVAQPGLVLARLSDGELQSIIATNLLAPIELTRALLPSMLANQRGFIGFVDSVGGHVALPSASIYCAAKFGLRGFAAALRREMRPHGVRVCIFCPGFIRTKLSEPAREIFKGFPLLMGTPEGVARSIVRTIARPRREVILPGYNRLIIWLDRNLPAFADAVADYYLRRILPRYEARRAAALREEDAPADGK